MFLFETFKYDDEWARKYYGSTYYSGNHNTYLYNTCYLDGIISDYKFKQSLPKEDIDRFTFTVNKFKMPDSELDNLYKITYLVHYAGREDPPFKQDQIDYLKNKLSILGDAVKIIAQYDAVMIIQYFIEKDEYRWNREHERVEAKEANINAIKLPEPSEETWLYMFEAYNFGKNPRVIFKKIKTLNELLEKLIVAFKLKWGGAVSALKSNMYSFLHSDTINKDNQLDNTYEAAYRYSLTYSIPEYIEEMMNDTKDALKSNGPIPVKAKHFAELLNNNNLVKKYSIRQYLKNGMYDIIMSANVELINGNEAYITIQHPNLYLIRIYKNLKVINNYADAKIEDKIGKDYFSLYNTKRSNHILNDSLDVYLDDIILEIYNMENEK